MNHKLFSLAAASCAATQIFGQQDIGDLTTIQYNTLLAGIVYGIIDKNDCTEIETCLKGGKADATLAYDAFTTIEAGDYFKGFTELATVV